jgi:enoyl-CoA hydratase
MYENIIVEKLETGVGLIRLNRPQAMNALNEALGREVVAALREWEADPEVRCYVITGNDKAFAAGADIKGMVEMSLADILYGFDLGMWDYVAALNKPIIAAVSGVCLGGGCELAMACDMIIASETAKFGQPEINLGVIPGAGGTQRLTRAVGKSLAMEMVLNNRWLTAAEAQQYGLANKIYPVESYLQEALKLAAEIAARAPIAVRIGKEAVNKSFEATLAEGVKYERRMFHLLFGTEDQDEGMKAFIEKRPANWQGK